LAYAAWVMILSMVEFKPGLSSRSCAVKLHVPYEE